MKFLLAFYLLFSFLFGQEGGEPPVSGPQETASIFSELIGGLVSPIGGQPVLAEVDLIAKGREPLYLKRIYIPPSIPWMFHRDKKIDKYALLQHLKYNYQGWRIFPHLWIEVDLKFHTARVTEENGMSLLFTVRKNHEKAKLRSHDYGFHNMQNDEVSGKYDPHNIHCYVDLNLKWVKIITPEGKIRIYKKKKKDKDTIQYRLEKEILLNGNICKYLYHDDNSLASIQTMDPKEQYVYAKIDIHGSFEKKENIRCVTHLGDLAELFYEVEHHKGKYYEPFFWKHKYDEYLPGKLVRVNSPFFTNEIMEYSSPQALLLNRSSKSINPTFHYTANNGDLYYRVEELTIPLNEEQEAKYRLKYKTPSMYDPEGNTEVTHPDGSITNYEFDEHYRVKKITYSTPDKQPLREKKYSWNEKGQLKKLKIEGLLKKEFEYDKYGNPTLEKTVGNLTGNGDKESLTVLRTFSQDKKNLLQKEVHENGLIIDIDYLPHTNLITERKCFYREFLLVREVNRYNEHNHLIESILDDGFRKKITRYTLRNSYPHIHMPETVSIWYEEDQMEKLLSLKRLTYDEKGNVIEEEHFDENATPLYTIYKKYNNRGECIYETNPIGQEAYYEYDNHGRLIAEIPFSERLKKEKKYDKKGRLVEEIDFHTTSYTYDNLDRLVEITTPLEFSKRFTYPFFNNNPKEIKQGDRSSSSVYDNFGREIQKTDENGYTTTYKYNALGLVTEATYQHGKELFRYTKEGKLQSHINVDGEKTTYDYDALGRMIYKNHEGAEEKFLYKGLLLDAYIDKEGYVTKFTYDGAGRKIKEEREKKEVLLAYNESNQLIKVQQGDKKTTYLKDYLDRVIKEITPTSTKIYTYDEEGNISSLQEGSDITYYSYDPLKRITKKIDPNGGTTLIEYIESDHLQVKTTDPKGLIKIETYDQYGKVIEREIDHVKKEHFTYDGCSNLIKQEEEIYREGEYLYTVTIERSYNSQGKVSSLKTEKGITAFTYLPSGKISSIIKPSGVTLFFEYDKQGFLKQLQSSDHTVSHELNHNKLGYLLSSNNFTREVDAFGNILKETFENGLTIEKKYDNHGNKIEIILPNNFSIHYKYEEGFLKEVKGKGFVHHYHIYGPHGEILSETNHERTSNQSGQFTSLLAPHLKQTCSYDLLGNLIESTLNDSIYSYEYDSLSQLIKETNPNESIDYPFDSHYNDQNLNHSLYDDNGNLREKNGYTLTYDALSRLIKADNGSTPITFTYDALGRRLSKNDEIYLYDDNIEIASFTKDHELKDLRILGLNAKPVAFFLSGELLLPIYDLMDRMQFLIDPSTETIRNQYNYTAFGEVLDKDEDLPCPWGYASRRLDIELNFIYFGKRYYDIDAHRWTTEDPLGSIDATNLYVFLLNNPFRYFDPLGLSAESIPSGPPIRDHVASDGDYMLYPRSFTYTVGEKTYPKLAFAFTNGIFNELKDSYASAKMISDFAGGAMVNVLFNATHYGWDLVECLAGLNRIPSTHATCLLVKQICEIFNNLPPDGILAYYHHSGGSILFRNALEFLPKAIRMRIISVGIAPGAIIPKELCLDATNFVSKRDIVPYLGILFDFIADSNQLLKHLTVIDCHPDASLFDHSIQSPTFEQPLKDMIKNNIQKYGGLN